MEIAVILVTLSCYSLVLFMLSEKFRIQRRWMLVFLVPMLVFAAGFSMRLSGVQPSIDVGFFMTDSSYLFVYVLFAFFLMLGQLKYWKR